MVNTPRSILFLPLNISSQLAAELYHDTVERSWQVPWQKSYRLLQVAGMIVCICLKS